MKVRAVVFDLDGTLADTLEAIAVTMNGVLGELGLAGHRRDAYRMFIGDGARKLAERVLPREKRGMVEEVVAMYRARLMVEGTGLSKVYAGVAEMLDGVVGRGMLMGVLTNKPAEATVEVMGKLFGRWKFAAVSGHVEGELVKPDPRKLWKMMEEMGVGREETVYVGDSNVDMKLAHAAGVRAIGAAWGMRGHAELEEHGADYILDEPGGLLKLLDPRN